MVSVAANGAGSKALDLLGKVPKQVPTLSSHWVSRSLVSMPLCDVASLPPNLGASYMTHCLLQLLIDGKWVDAASGKTFPVIDPRTEEEMTRVAEADAADIDLAVRVRTQKQPVQIPFHTAIFVLLESYTLFVLSTGSQKGI
jgi:hypothetical protein